jgi:xylan 1,4-beta-xylosidase
MLSYWAFSDVFEEQGVVKEPFYGGFGLIAADGIPKPSVNAFKLLHTLGTTRIAVDSSSALVTRREDGTVVMAVWNMFLPGETGPHKRVTIDLGGSAGNRRATISRLDAAHGSVLGAYAAMGKPPFPTQAQIQALRSAASLPAPEKVRVDHGQLTIDLPPQGLALIELH